jgi:hypothetical protein
MFDGIIIAANEGHHDLRSVTQHLLQELAGTHGTVARFEAHPRLLFCANTTKELIQIVYDSHFITPHSRDITLNFLNGLNVWNQGNLSVPVVPIVQPFHPDRIPLH